MQRVTSFVFALVLLTSLVACGGGGGGGDGPEGAPGTLRLMALEGAPAPGTAGVFLAIPAQPVMAAAEGGYCAFVLPTTDGSLPEVLYVAEPDDVPTIVPVFAIGDLALSPGGGTIDDILATWICDDGTVLAFVLITGDAGGVTFGVLSASVSGGVASAKTGVIFHHDDLTGVGGVGDLTAFVLSSACKTSDGALWFLGEDDGTDINLYSVGKDGTGLTRRAGFGDPLGVDRGGGTIISIDAFTVDSAGSIFAYVVTASTGVLERMLVRGPGLNVEFFGTGDPLPTSGSVTDAFKGGSFVTFTSGQVVWVAQGNAGGIDDVMMLYEPLNMINPWTVLARTGDTAPQTGMGTIGTIDTLHAAKSCIFPGIHVSVVGGSGSASEAVYRVLGAGNGNLDPDSSNVSAFNGGFVPSAWVGLTTAAPASGQPYSEVSRNGSTLFAQSFGGTSQVLWSVSAGTFVLAEPGMATPDGDIFGSFATDFEGITANDVALFRANVDTAGSGLYRRGP